MSNMCDTCIARYTLFSMIKFAKMFVDIQAMAEEQPIPPEEESRGSHDSGLLATSLPSAEYVRLRHHHMIS
jgi:hypothetical protein